MIAAITSKENRTAGEIVLFEVDEANYSPEMSRIITKDNALDGTVLTTNWGYPEGNRTINLSNILLSLSNYDELIAMKADNDNDFLFHHMNDSWNVILRSISGKQTNDKILTSMSLSVISKIDYTNRLYTGDVTPLGPLQSGIFYPAASGDDGYYQAYGNTLKIIDTQIRMGHYGPSYNDPFIRFSNVSIPEGATINSAFIEFTSSIAISNTICNLNIYLNKSDDAIAPTDVSEFNALSLTEAVAWNNVESWSSDYAYNSVDFKTILQTIINRAGWSSGNALQTIIKNNGSSSGAGRLFYSYNYGSNYPALYVTWREAS